MKELECSNTELEQFAYIVSHDLQEPLRMVSSYVELINKRSKDKLDNNAYEFISFAQEGAYRMQKMINDLLVYSRLGTQKKKFEPIDCNILISHVLDNLQISIRENKARIIYDSLPTVLADEVKLMQLFQNLINNAIKFRRKKSPVIHISAELKQDKWILAIQDNGIGIEPQYFEHIFTVFRRLHTREKYPGTGIGLAICKKIIESHGGTIWINSEVGKGTTFFFTLPVYKK